MEGMLEIQRILEKYSNEGKVLLFAIININLVVVVKSSYEERYLHALSYSHFVSELQ